jgi:hypothetical protein
LYVVAMSATEFRYRGALSGRYQYRDQNAPWLRPWRIREVASQLYREFVGQ